MPCLGVAFRAEADGGVLCNIVGAHGIAGNGDVATCSSQMLAMSPENEASGDPLWGLIAGVSSV